MGSVVFEESSMPNYTRNFLTNVIFRVDYPSILSLAKEPPAAFQRAIQDDYPRASQGKNVELVMTEDQPSSVSESRSWAFSDMDRQNKVTLTSAFLAFENKGYTHFPDFSPRCVQVLEALREAYRPQVISRIGLRYINVVCLPDGDPFDWSGYISDSLTASVQAFVDDQDAIAQAESQLHFNKDDHQIRLRFGLSNPDFPNTVTRKQFLLDFDCFSRDEVSLEQVMGRLDEFNVEIYRLFELCIGDELRAIMFQEDE